ncbi:MAG: hypothetical protein RQ866_06890, partial [Bacteroidales bacterium]|nr:hypothetical protein [Bacteroidales bacterium]
MKPLIRRSLLLCCFFALLCSVTAQSNKKADVLLLYPKVSPGDSLKNNDLYQSLLTQCNEYDSYQGIEQHSEDARYTVLSLSEVSRYAYEVDADYFLVTSVCYVSPIRIVNAKLFSTIDMTVEWIDNYRVYADTNADTIASLIAFSIDEIITRANSLKAQPLNL